MDARLQISINRFTEEITELASESGRKETEVLLLVSQVLASHAAQWRPRHTFYNWWRRENRARHESTAVQLMTLEDSAKLETLTGWQKGMLKMEYMTRVTAEEYNALTDSQREKIMEEFNASSSESTFVDTNTITPRTPTKTRLKSIASTRKDGFKTIEKMLEKAIMYAERNSFDIAAFISDKVLQLDGGVGYQQLGTTNGAHFVALLQEKGMNGECLQALSHASNKKLLPAHVDRTATFINGAPGLSTFPARDMRLPKTSSRQGLLRLKSSLLRDAIGAYSDLESFTPLHNIKQDPSAFERDLQVRGLQVVIKVEAGLSLADVINNQADVLLLQRVYMALMTNTVVIKPIASSSDHRLTIDS